MDEKLTEGCYPPVKDLDIFVKRIFGKYENTETIFFGTAVDPATNKVVKVPYKFCICNHETCKGPLPVKCVEVKTEICEACQDIACGSKAMLKIKFKLILFVKYGKCDFDIFVLPDSTPNKIWGCQPLPITIDNETLSYDPSDNTFVWTKTIPLSQFGKIPKYVLDDPTLQSHITVRRVAYNAEVMGPCTDCQPQAADRHVDTDPGSTEVDVTVTAAICDKLGIDQDIMVSGTPVDC